jgi:hypothetical protein
VRRAVQHSELTGRNARTGSFDDQRRSTWDKLSEAIDAGDRQSALELADFALDGECRFIFDLLTGWADDLRFALARRGVPEGYLALTDERLRATLAMPDGSRFDRDLGWAALESRVDALRAHVVAGEWEAGAAAVDPAREAWRVLHDRVVDLSYGWMSAWVDRFGEESVPEMFRAIGGDHFEEFFALGDPARHEWTEGGCEAVVLDTLEAMRAHLSTVRRDGAPITMTEHEDRYEFEFDPCGSGGRALRGDILEGTPSRTDKPYEFAVIEEAHEWTDGIAGMCVYCNHCQQLYEQWTIDRAGIPFLVVDPPTVADGIGHENPKRCRYTVYKRPEDVPDEVYSRCGRRRPK